jgi:DNA-binding transcriptional LysR family regulator
LLKREVAVFEELRQAVKDIQYLNDPAAGEVRIGCAESLAAGVLPALVDRFARSSPKVVIHVLTALAATLEFRELRDRTVDLMIGRIFTPFHDPDIDVDVIGHDDLFVVAGSRSPWARRRALALEELMDEPWVFYPRDNRIGLYAERVFRSNGLELPRESVVSHSLHLRLQLVRTGRYLTMLHGSVLRLNAGPWSLKALPVDLSLHTVPVAIFTLRNRTLNPVVSRFIQHAHEASVAMAGAPSKRPATSARRGESP